MRIRFAVLVLFVAVSAVAQQTPFFPGNLYYETRDDAPMYTPPPDYELWLRLGDMAFSALTGGTLLIDKSVPIGLGHPFFIPSGKVFIFDDGRSVSFWNGIPVYYNDPTPAYTLIFQHDVPLTDIAPMRSGHYLAATTTKLIEFDLRGKIAEYPFPGANFIDLTFDQCTLLYTNGDAAVHRYDICTQKAQSDFATLMANESAGAVRQLPNGDVLVAAGDAVVEFDAGGSLRSTHPFAGATHLALSPDAKSFLAGGANNHTPVIRDYDLATGTYQSIATGNPEMRPLATASAIVNFAVVSEWRASSMSTRARGVRHR